MKYMMLIHHDDEALAKADQSLWADYAAFNEALVKAGGSAGERLHPAASATNVRIRDGKAEVLDGPYADTKEKLAGYFMIDAATPEEAVAWAQRCPSARYGTIEVRPIMDMHRTPCRQDPRPRLRRGRAGGSLRRRAGAMAG